VPTENTTRWGEGVRIGPPRLHALHFDYDGTGELPQPITVQFELEVSRTDPFGIEVEFTTRVLNVEGLVAHATYRVGFMLDPRSPEGQDPEDALRKLTCRIAPVTLYPFCREALTSTAQRAGLSNFVTPITNVGALWSEEEITIPEWEEEPAVG
jgi:hypothetical protein